MVDRKKLIELIREFITGYYVFDIADHLIANGVVIPVRCKDCEQMIEKGWCSLHSTPMNRNDFCSYGEKRGV